jgi:hypothetical protein
MAWLQTKPPRLHCPKIALTKTLILREIAALCSVRDTGTLTGPACHANTLRVYEGKPRVSLIVLPAPGVVVASLHPAMRAYYTKFSLMTCNIHFLPTLLPQNSLTSR